VDEKSRNGSANNDDVRKIEAMDQYLAALAVSPPKPSIDHNQTTKTGRRRNRSCSRDNSKNATVVGDAIQNADCPSSKFFKPQRVSANYVGEVQVFCALMVMVSHAYQFTGTFANEPLQRLNPHHFFPDGSSTTAGGSSHAAAAATSDGASASASGGDATNSMTSSVSKDFAMAQGYGATLTLGTAATAGLFSMSGYLASASLQRQVSESSIHLSFVPFLFFLASFFSCLPFFLPYFLSSWLFGIP
jgi:hypothetical protein